MSRPPLILAPTAAGLPGVPDLRRGPDCIREQLALLEVLGEGPAWDVRRLDLGSADQAAAAGDAVAGVTAVAEAVAKAVAPLAAGGQVPLVAGGDHTIAAGSVRGVRRGLRQRRGRDVPLYLLWLDAHPDLNTPETSPSGNLHGMVLAGLLGAGPLAFGQVQNPRGKVQNDGRRKSGDYCAPDAMLPPERVVLAGVRDLDPGERDFLAAQPSIRRWDVAALRGDGWRSLLASLLQEIERNAGLLYVSLDLDVIDPAFAPGVAVPVPDGAHPDDVLTLLRHVAASGLLAGADVVELHPAADRDGQTAALAAQALLALAGHINEAEPTQTAHFQRELARL